MRKAKAITWLSVVVVGLMVLLSGTQASAALFTSRAEWEAAVGLFADVDLAGQTTVFDTVSDISLPSGTTVSFSKSLEARQVPSGWATWSGGQTPRVLFLSSSPYSVTGAFSSPVAGFGLEMEPNYFSAFILTLTLSDGTSLGQLVPGYAGAKFFGWSGADVTAMTLSSADGSGGFAFGRMVEAAPVPEPGTMLLLGSGLVGLAGWGRKKFRK